MSIKDRITSLSRVPASKLIPHPQNWRTHPDDQRAGLASVLNEIGWADAIIARDLGDGTYQIIDGHLRAEMSGEDEVPVLVVDVDEQEAKLLLATHDPLAWMAEHDDAHLSGLLSELTGYGEDVAALLDSIGEAYEVNLSADDEDGELEDVEPQIDRAEELREKWGTERGQLWIIEGKQTHRLMCGDSTEEADVIELMDGSRALLFATDPPYGVSYTDEARVGADRAHVRPQRMPKWADGIENDQDVNGEQIQPFLEACFRVACAHALDDHAAWYLWHAHMTQGFFAAAAAAAAANLVLHRQIIWVKPSLLFGFGDYHWQHELCFYGWVKGNRPQFLGERNQTTIWNIKHEASNGNRVHPTQKPLEVFTIPMRNHMNPGDVCYEPFAGSGTQFLAADQLGMRCCGMELTPKYVAVILQRMTDVGCKCRLLEPAAT